MLVSQALFLLSDSIVKVAGQTLAPGQIMAVRGVIATYLVGAILVATVGWRKWYLALTPLVVLRALAEAGGAAFFLVALQHLQLGTITVLTQVTPLILAVASAMILGERVGPARWYAVVVGFVGVVLVAQPSAKGLDANVVSALMVALLVAARELITRYIKEEVPTNVVTFSSTLAVCLMGFGGVEALGLETRPWGQLTTDNGTLLVLSAILVTLGVWFVVQAFRDVEVSVVSPFRYSAVAWAMLYGYLLWGERPNVVAIAGVVLIVLSGLFAIHQDFQTARERAAARDDDA